MREPVYIYDGNIDKLQLAVEKLNKRAAKLCVPAIQLHISPRETCFTCVGAKGPTVSTDPKAWGEDAKPVGHERAEVILRGEPPKLAGWTFAAVVDHLSNGCITRYPFAGGDIDLTPYRGVEATCDHCSTARKRHETFIVVHDTGTEKRVGRKCLAAFLGHSNPASLIGHINLWGRAFALVEGAEEAGFGTGVTMLEIHEFLGYVACQMREHGWCSRGKAYEEGHHGATADLAQSAYWSSDPKGHGQPQTEDLTRGKKALAWARALTDSEVESNDYLYNLRAVCTDDYIRPKRGGLAGSVIVAAERAFEKAAEKAAEATKSNLHIGATGERLTQDLTLVSTREISGFYGVSVLHKFEYAAGNLFVWFASNPQIIPDPEPLSANNKRAINVGETHTLAGTVKGHDDYKGRMQTKLTRVSVPKPKKAKKAKKPAKPMYALDPEDSEDDPKRTSISDTQLKLPVTVDEKTSKAKGVQS